jgi:dsDNA-specific endonuclease/ATPase MutS2
MKRILLIAIAAGALGACQADRGDVADARKDLMQKQQDAEKEVARAERDAQKDVAKQQRDVAKAEQKGDEHVADARKDAGKEVADARKDYNDTLRDYNEHTLPQQGQVWGTVVKSSADEITLRDQQGQKTRMKIGDHARILSDGQPVPAGKIAEGTPVRASFERDGKDIEASEIEMGTGITDEYHQPGDTLDHAGQQLHRDLKH